MSMHLMRLVTWSVAMHYLSPDAGAALSLVSLSLAIANTPCLFSSSSSTVADLTPRRGTISAP